MLRRFQLSGNFFRATENGGVLEPQDSALELGEEYFFVSQRQLANPRPDSVALTREPKQHRSWNVYRLLLRDDPATRADDMAELSAYFGRSIALPKQRIDVVWPPPHRFDSDGAPVFNNNVTRLMVRSDGSRPLLEAGSGSEAKISDLGQNIYQVDLELPEEEAILWAEFAHARRIRFEKSEIVLPAGVILTSIDDVADLTLSKAIDIAGRVGDIEIGVPSELLWRKITINGQRVRPLPSGISHQFTGPLTHIDAGAFGSLQASQPKEADGINLPQWWSRVDRFVAASVGTTASENLKNVSSLHQVFRWAVESKAISLLPLVLSAFSSEVDRDLS